MPRLAAIALTALAFEGGPALAAEPADPVARGDRAWEERAVGSRGDRASAVAVAAAVDAYTEAVAAEPARVEARWKLMRALFFLGEHAAADRESQLAAFERGRELGEEGLALLVQGGGETLRALDPLSAAARLRAEPEATALVFWTAAHWGLWGRTTGKFAAARQGVATRIRDYTEIVIALDERFEDGGGRRMMGRLHSEAPRIPFFTGWIDRDQAIAELERALEIAPDHWENRHFWAQAILDHRSERRDEALAVLQRLAEEKPRPGNLVEDRQTLAEVEALLARARR